MTQVTAICDTCGTPFATENFIQLINSDATITGGRVGPCPKCGGMGTVPDQHIDRHGRVTYLKDVYRGLYELRQNKKLLQQILDRVEQLSKQQDLKLDEVYAAITKEAPEAAVLRRFFSPEVGNAAQVIMALIMLIQFILSSGGNPPAQVPIQIVNQITIQMEQATPTFRPTPTRTPTPTATRRPPNVFPTREQRQAASQAMRACPCGSGQRFAECCGKTVVYE